MADPAFNVLSLCSGVNGLGLGLRLAVPHAREICMVEREAAACASLVASMEAGWFHKAPIWMGDIAEFNARPWRGMVDCVTSSDPCQPNSVAGKRLGADDDRFLIDQVIRIIEECGAPYFWRENVPGNADGQLAAIVPALEGMGYRVAAGIFSSAETGNTMRRERLFIMAEREGVEWGLGTRSERECLPDAGGSSLGVDGSGSGRHIDPDEELQAGRDGPVDAGGSMGGAESLGRREGRPEPAGQQGRRSVAGAGGEHGLAHIDGAPAEPWPFTNVWLGVSVEDQTRADERREDFANTPAAVKFVSYEPALGPVDWSGWEFVDQIISGGESGPKARPSHPDWHRASRDFCAANGIAYFFKQWGEWVGGTYDGQTVGDYVTFPDWGKVAAHDWSNGLFSARIGKARAGRLLDGREHSEFPA